jgi:hypothetical protein
MPASSLGDRREGPPPPPVVVHVADAPRTPTRSWWGVVTCTLCILSATAVGVWAALSSRVDD